MDHHSFFQPQSDWPTFCAARPGYLTALAETVESSFLRQDTPHPVFCGCIDWHSSVHGAYALLTVARLLNQPRWADSVDAAFKPECLDGELASLRCGDLHHELPYGYAWFLKLGREREEGWGRKDLRPIAEEIAERLRQWLMALSDDAVKEHVQRREYGNLSWPLFNLWEWDSWNGHADHVERLMEWTRSRLLPKNPACPSSLDQSTDEFFAPALQRCRALLTILPQEESRNWLKSAVPENWNLLPVTAPSTPHAAGLNFSRSWGLWTLFHYTGNPVFRDLYVNHIVTHMERPEYWRDDYRKHGHWVPQFGIYAIALGMEEASGEPVRSSRT